MLTGERADTPKPEAILLVLDSTNLGRHLMLAAPILALGLPTLMILNMADDLRNRGGHVDIEASFGAARRARGAGQRAAGRRHRRRCSISWPAPCRSPRPWQLPVLHDVPKCREWAGRVGSQAGYRAPVPPKWTRRLDRVFLHPVAGPLVFCVVVVARLPDHLHARPFR